MVQKLQKLQVQIVNKTNNPVIPGKQVGNEEEVPWSKQEIMEQALGKVDEMTTGRWRKKMENRRQKEMVTDTMEGEGKTWKMWEEDNNKP